ncbi:MAG: DUF4432 family protein [Rhizobiales bacterium]|nr:DUF4432 family protein [Hyphomicrobiales bacterium]
MGFDLHGERLDRAALRARVGDLAQVAGLRSLTLEDGQGRGQRLIEMETGGGLSVEILPDRTLDIGQVRYRGVPVAWIGPNGLRSPFLPGVPEHGHSPMERGIAGLLTTCGFEHARLPAARPRPPGFLDANHPLHGSIPFTPADGVSARQVWSGENGALRVEGRVTQFTLDGPSYELRRRIEAPVGGATLIIEDEVENIGHADAPLMALYHFNFGWPAVGPGARFEMRDGSGRWAGAPLTPLGGEPARAVDICAAPAFEGRAAARLAGGAVDVEIAFDPATLPYVQTWRRTEPGLNVFSIEPITNRLAPRAELEADGEIRTLAPGAVARMSFALGFSARD